jgi:hypothetical protein
MVEDAGSAADGDLPDGFVAPVCKEGAWDGFHDLMPAVSYDYAALYVGPSADIPGPRRASEDGEACASATDPTACTAALEAAIAGAATPFVVTVSGSEVVVYGSGLAQTLLDFLGAIDRPEKAMFVVGAAGYDLLCSGGYAAVREVDGGYEVIATRLTQICDPVERTRYVLEVRPDATIVELSSEVVSSEDGVCIGRRPDGLVPRARESTTASVGEHLAGVAYLEAAAVVEFERIANELRLYGASDDLVCAARHAAADEVRHAATMAALAREHGARSGAPAAEVESREARGMFELALHNAVEGCVRETFGALVGTFQSMSAEADGLREAMAEIAEDETRHAALSWEIAAWIEPRLTAAERIAIRDAQHRAIERLRVEMSIAPERALASSVGLPPPAQCAQWIDALERSLWRASAVS